MLNLNAFTLRALSDTLTVITLAKRGGVSDIVDLEVLIKQAQEHKKPRDRRPPATIRAEHLKGKGNLKNVFVKCTKCGNWARPLVVNTKPGNQIDGDYKSCSVCYNQECMHTDYYSETVEELRDKYGVIK